MCRVWLGKKWPLPPVTVLLLASGILPSPPIGVAQSSPGLLAQAEPSPRDSAAKSVSAPTRQRRDPESAARCTAKVADGGGTPGIFPAAPPLPTHCKFELFLWQTYSPYTFVSVSFEATWAQMMAQWPQYGGGMQGWGKRLGATLADTESRRFIQGFVFASALHQDPRYFPSHRKRLIGRAWYAASRVVITRGDGGQSELNTSELLGALSISSLQNLYYPMQCRTFGGTMNRFLGALSSDATSDILHEFTPDLKRLFHKHAPNRIREIEQKFPLPPEDR